VAQGMAVTMMVVMVAAVVEVEAGTKTAELWNPRLLARAGADRAPPTALSKAGPPRSAEGP
jgi:hypothetical protein